MNQVSQPANVFDRDPARFVRDFYMQSPGARRVYLRSIDKIVRLSRPLAGKRVADLGCGSGVLVRALRTETTDVVGFDSAENMLALARELNPHVPFVRGDVTALDWPDQDFDVAVTRAVFQHVADPLAFAREMHRLLRPGGRGTLFVPFDNPLVRIPRAVSNRVVTGRTSVIGTLYPRDAIVHTIRAAGLTVDRIDYYGLVFYPLSGYGTGIGLAIADEAFWDAAIILDELLIRRGLGRFGVNLIVSFSRPA